MLVEPRGGLSACPPARRRAPGLRHEPARDHRRDAARLGTRDAGGAGGGAPARLPAAVRGRAFPPRVRARRRQVSLPRRLAEYALRQRRPPRTLARIALPARPLAGQRRRGRGHPFKLATSQARNFLNSSFNQTATSLAREGRPSALMHPARHNSPTREGVARRDARRRRQRGPLGQSRLPRRSRRQHPDLGRSAARPSTTRGSGRGPMRRRPPAARPRIRPKRQSDANPPARNPVLKQDNLGLNRITHQSPPGTRSRDGKEQGALINAGFPTYEPHTRRRCARPMSRSVRRIRREGCLSWLSHRICRRQASIKLTGRGLRAPIGARRPARRDDRVSRSARSPRPPPQTRSYYSRSRG